MNDAVPNMNDTATAIEFFQNEHANILATDVVDDTGLLAIGKRST